MDLLDKASVLYFEPESIGSPEGARCQICWMFNSTEKSCLEVDGYISGSRGICGLYFNGDPVAENLPMGLWPARKISKSEAGYSDRAPTHCANCIYMLVPKVDSDSPCKKVKGLVDGRGCCSLWEPIK